MIESQGLWRGSGHESFTGRFERDFGEWLGRKYVLGVCSGTCAEKAAFAALGLELGDEAGTIARCHVPVSYTHLTLPTTPYV